MLLGMTQDTALPILHAITEVTFYTPKRQAISTKMWTTRILQGLEKSFLERSLG